MHYLFPVSIVSHIVFQFMTWLSKPAHLSFFMYATTDNTCFRFKFYYESSKSKFECILAVLACFGFGVQKMFNPYWKPFCKGHSIYAWKKTLRLEHKYNLVWENIFFFYQIALSCFSTSVIISAHFWSYKVSTFFIYYICLLVYLF